MGALAVEREHKDGVLDARLDDFLLLLRGDEGNKALDGMGPLLVAGNLDEAVLNLGVDFKITV